MKRSCVLRNVLLLLAIAFLMNPVSVKASETEGDKETVSGNLKEYGAENVEWVLADGTLTISGEGALPSWWNGNETPIVEPEPTSLSEEAQVDNLTESESNETDSELSEEDKSDNPVDYVTPWMEYNEDILSVVIDDKITSVSPFSFYDCCKLENVLLGNSMTIIGKYAFSSCYNLTELDLPESITEIQAHAFENTGIVEIVIPQKVTKICPFTFYSCQVKKVTLEGAVTEIGESAFESTLLQTLSIKNDCIEKIGSYAFAKTGLENVSFGKEVTEIGKGAFAYCDYLKEFTWFPQMTTIPEECFSSSALEKIVIPDSVTKIEKDAFSFCQLLSDVQLGKGIEKLDSCFRYCYALKKVDLSELHHLQTLEDTFENCKALESVILPEELKQIGPFAFGYCSALKTVILPSELTSIEEFAFDSAKSLENVSFPDGITSIEECAFRGCDSLKTITLPAELISLKRYAFDSCDLLERIEFNSKITEIGNECFYNCSSLIEVQLPDSLQTIGEGAFRHNTALETVEIGKELKVLPARVFSDTTSLVDVTVHSNLDEVGGQAFYESGVQTVKFRNVDTIARMAFYGCKSLNNIQWDSVKEIGYGAFCLCSELRGIEFPDTLQTIGEQAFSSCDLRELKIPNSVMTIGEGAFESNFNLEKLTLSDNLKEISDNCFKSCNITSLEIPSKITRIGGYAFYGNSGITRLVIPENVTEIGDSAFGLNKNLKGVVIEGEQVKIDGLAFNGCSLLELIVFKGEKGEIGNNTFLNVTATAVYPSYPATWKEIPESTAYGAKNITWIPDYMLNSADESLVEILEQLVSTYKTDRVFSFGNDYEHLEKKYAADILGPIQAVLDIGIYPSYSPVCAGMSLCASTYNEYQTPQYGNVKLGTLKKDNIGWDAKYSMRDWIIYAHIYENHTCTADYEKACYEGNYQLIRDKVYGFQSGNESPVLITIRRNASASHALWAVGVGDEDDNETTLIVYDPNYPSQWQLLTLLKTNGQYSGWKYTPLEWGSESGGTMSCLQVSDDFAYWIKNGMTPESVRGSGDYSVYLTANHCGLEINAELENGKHYKEVLQGVTGTIGEGFSSIAEKLKYILPIQREDAANEAGEDSTDSVGYWLNVGNTFEITNPTNEPIDYALGAMYSGIRIVLPQGASAKTSVQDDAPNELNVTLAENKEIQFTYMDAEKDSDEVNEVTIYAEGSEKVSSKQMDNGIKVTGIKKMVIGEGEKKRTYNGLSEEITYEIQGTEDSKQTENLKVVNTGNGKELQAEEQKNDGKTPISIKKVSKIKLTGISTKIAAGKKIKLTAAITPSNASNKAVTWKSGNTKIAKVDQNGNVTVLKKTGGKKVTITATAKDGSGKSASYKITSMKGVVKKVSVSGAKSVKAGKSIKLKAKVTASKGANKKLKWTSSNTKYATVSSSGKVKTYKAGKKKTVKITAMATDGSNKKKTVKIKIK